MWKIFIFAPPIFITMKKVLSAYEQEDRKQRLAKRFFGILFIVICFIIWKSCSSSENEAKAKPPMPDTSLVITIAQDFIKQELKSPTSAEFHTKPEWYTVTKDSIYKVISTVDADNSYGAKLRSRYMVILKYTGGDPYSPKNWYARHVELMEN